MIYNKTGIPINEIEILENKNHNNFCKELTKINLNPQDQENLGLRLQLLNNVVERLRELSPLWEMHLDGIDLDTVEWTAH